MDNDTKGSAKHLIKQLENIEWDQYREDEKTWILRALIKAAQDWQSNHNLEPTIGKLVASSAGYCHCCRSQVTFSSSDGWLRDHYACSNCGSTPRERNLMRALDELVPAWPQKIIHESSPSSMRIKNMCNGYAYSYYDPDAGYGSTLPTGGTCENLERLTLQTGSVDVFITQDVLEHVMDPAAACKEIIRTIKPGGWFLFTTPRHPHLRTSIQRAKIECGEIQYILEPEYHGSPNGDGRALVTYDWGVDFEALVKSWCGLEVTTRTTVDQARGIDGAFFEVFALQKPN